MASISATDAWAVGEQNLDQTLIEHWNGTAWQIVPSTNPGPGSNVLNSTGSPPPGGAGALFGLAVAPHGEGVYFVDDNTNTLNLLH